MRGQKRWEYKTFHGVVNRARLLTTATEKGPGLPKVHIWRQNNGVYRVESELPVEYPNPYWIVRADHKPELVWGEEQETLPLETGAPV